MSRHDYEDKSPAVVSSELSLSSTPSFLYVTDNRDIKQTFSQEIYWLNRCLLLLNKTGELGLQRRSSGDYFCFSPERKDGAEIR